jgi:hypothetical protein
MRSGSQYLPQPGYDELSPIPLHGIERRLAVRKRADVITGSIARRHPAAMRSIRLQRFQSLERSRQRRHVARKAGTAALLGRRTGVASNSISHLSIAAWLASPFSARPPRLCPAAPCLRFVFV